jgi:hypothetical protein
MSVNRGWNNELLRRRRVRVDKSGLCRSAKNVLGCSLKLDCTVFNLVFRRQ